MSQLKEAIIECLSVGMWVKRPALLEYVNRYTQPDTHLDREMRLAVEGLIKADGHCIASSEKGYKLILSEKELNEAVLYLDKKAEAIAIRKNCLKANYWSNVSKNFRQQLELFETTK